MKNKKRSNKGKEGSFCRKHYSKSWEYIKESKKQIYFILIVFGISILIGALYQPSEIVEIIEEFLRDLLQRTEGLNAWQLMIFILNNNLQSSFFAMILGFLFAVFPFMAAFSNGYLLGFVAEKSIMINGISSLWRLAPHGIFEFPAIILALGLGTRFGMFWFAGKGKKMKEFFRRLIEGLRVFLFVIIPLLIIAAIIEGILIFLIR